MSDTAIRIRNYHLDGYGHVNNARYLEFLEEARWHFFERHNLLAIRYLRPAAEGDTLLIRSSIRTLEPERTVIRQTATLAHNGKTAVQADITVVPVSDGRGTCFPPDVYNLLQQLQNRQP